MPKDQGKSSANPPDPVDGIATGAYTGIAALGAKHLNPRGHKSADSKLHRDSSYKTRAEEEPEEPEDGSSQ